MTWRFQSCPFELQICLKVFHYLYFLKKQVPQDDFEYGTFMYHSVEGMQHQFRRYSRASTVLKMAKSSPNAARNPPQSCPFELKLSELEVHNSTATWLSMSEKYSFSVEKSWFFDFPHNLRFGFPDFTKEKSFHLKEFPKMVEQGIGGVEIWTTHTQ